MNYRFFDLPKLPEHLAQKCLDAVAPNISPFYLVDPTKKEEFIQNVGYGEPDDLPEDGFSITDKRDMFDYLWSTKETPVRVSIYDAPQEVVDWVYENISPLIDSEFESVDRPELFVMDQGTRMFPHTDFKTFKYNLNYILSTGGEHAETVFYKPKAEHEGKRIVTIIPYRDSVIDKVMTVKVDQHQWCMLERNKIHSVENLTGPRVLLQIGVTRV